MKNPTHFQRTVRGHRPQLFDQAPHDELMTMILAVAQETAVLRERLDTAERVMAKHGIKLGDEIEAFEADETVLTHREAWRQDFYSRLFFYSSQVRSELENQHTEDSYKSVLAQTASGD